MFSISLRNDDDRTRSYSISSLGEAGWEVKLEQEGELTRHVVYHDWHRVERMLALFQLEVSNLTEHGWRETQSVP
jgi:hypothetical protein